MEGSRRPVACRICAYALAAPHRLMKSTRGCHEDIYQASAGSLNKAAKGSSCSIQERIHLGAIKGDASCTRGPRGKFIVATERIRIRTKLLGLSKVVHNAQLQVKTVLTLEPFDYVDLWLRRQHKDEALFYWRQARDFHRASIGLPMESAPLVLYYCFMNAAKALLASKGVTFNPHHGVGPHRMRG